MKKIVGYDYLACFFALTALFGFSLCNIGACSSKYYITVLLPAAYLVGYIIWGLGSRNTSVVVKKLVMVLMAIKMVLFPCLVLINGGLENDRFSSSAYDHIPEAVILQILEYSVVCFFITFVKWPQEGINDRELVGQMLAEDSRYSKNAWRIIFLCIAVTIAVVIVYPAFMYRYRPIFFLNEASEIQWRQSAGIASASLPFWVYYPVNWLISESRFALAYMLVLKVYTSRYLKRSGTKLFASFAAILAVLVLIVPDSVATSIYAALTLIFFLLLLYPDKRRVVIGIAAIMCISILVFAFIIGPLLSGNHIAVSAIALKLEVYFSGYLNTSAAVGMDSIKTSFGKLDYFLGDFFRSFPVLRGFFTSMPISNELFNESLGYDVVYNSQIIPLEGQGYFYLWYPGAVLFTFVHMLALKMFYTRMMQTGSTFGFYVHGIMTLLMTFGLVMYGSFLNFSLILEHIPLLLITDLFVRRKKHERFNLS
ncbi:MAG: hypothetical protein MR636_10540 [Clostridiales bacterium]|nr:hypothetical protein [Clostridiales bacterium]